MHQMVKEMHLQENTLFDLWRWPQLQGQGHTKCCSVSSTLCDLYTCKVGSCYVWRLRWRCIYKKPDGRTDGKTDGRANLIRHLLLPSTLNIMWPIHMQSLKVIRLSVKKEVHLQEIAIYDLWPWPKGQDHRKYCPVPSTLFYLSTCRVWSKYINWLRRSIYKKTHYLTFDVDPNPKVKVTQKVAQWPLHHVIYTPAKLAVATFDGLGGDAFTRNLMEGQTDRQSTERLW